MTFPPHHRDDAALARALIAREPHARAVLWRRFAPLVRNLVARAFPSSADIDDIVQDIFVCLLQRVHTLARPSALPAYVLSVTRFTILHHHRWMRLRRHDSLGVLHESLFTISPDPESREELGRVLDRVAGSPRLGRSAFLLRSVYGLGITQVARILGCSTSTVKRHAGGIRYEVIRARAA